MNKECINPKAEKSRKAVERRQESRARGRQRGDEGNPTGSERGRMMLREEQRRQSLAVFKHSSREAGTSCHYVNTALCTSSTGEGGRMHYECNGTGEKLE